jgi:O-antigen ligase
MTKLDKAIEGCWLGAAALVPLAIVPESWAIGFIEGPKIFVLRSITLLLVVLLSADWASRSGATVGFTSVAQNRGGLASTATRLRGQPIAMAAAVVAMVTLVSAALSPVTSVSVWGVDPGRDSYGLFSVASYLVIFIAVATHLRLAVQIRRLIWVLTASSMVLGLYGIEQHFGIDPFLSGASAQNRVSLTFGNPVFAGTYLLMTIPLTIALWQAWRERYGTVAHVVIGAGLIVMQTTALAFTLSRGPMLSLMVAFAVFLGAMGFVMGARAVGRPAASIALAVAVSVVLGYIPVSGTISGAGWGEGGAENGTGALAARLSTVGTEFTPKGGLSARYTIWSVAAKAYVSVPWVDTAEFSDIPSLRLAPLRPVIGYGPDMFRYAYSLQGDTQHPTISWHGHNFVVHTAIELGLLGVLAYAAMAMATAFALVRMLLAARRGEVSPWMGYVLFGLIGMFAGRSLDQMVGKSQVSDLTQAWIMAGVVLAMVRMPASEWLEPLKLQAAGTAPSAPGPRKRTAGSRRSPSRGRRGSSSGTPGVRDPLCMATVVVIGVLTFVFWWQTVLVDLNSTFLVGQAISASEAGQHTTAGNLLVKSVDRSPSSTFPRSTLGKSLLAGSRLDSDTQARVSRLLEAQRIINGALDRNPLDYRAWGVMAEITLDLASLDQTFAAEAVATAETAAALLPGLRPPAEQWGAALLLAGGYERALEVARSSRELAANTDPKDYLLSFIESQALQGLGRTDEAYAIALMLSEFRALQGLGMADEIYANAVLLSESGRPDAPTLAEALEGGRR